MPYARCPYAAERARLIEQYEALLQLTERMLKLSHNNKWDELIAMETDYIAEVASIGGPLPIEHLDEATQARIGELLEAILDNDMRLRQQLIERRDALGDMLQVSRRQQDLHRAYSGGKVINAGNRFRQETS
ncbi:flagellar protein FliT [Halomonas huangheensis]|uniref:Flagellar protein FliT n=1 Tax=Halomonas huangheensis TaxID=1178482 RepID=W1N5N7_9GAMM|nr:flagellar protein FliT [Halomonas huangheensis]ALM54272.1 hypothetical protein AR456_19865 [Halomonas huangheensis]ERL50823.1 hypothetical protein BJB45_19700 [Halomonas huangheensis]